MFSVVIIIVCIIVLLYVMLSKCSSGYFFDDISMTCNACPIGTYNFTSYFRSKCVNCPPGQYSSSTGTFYKNVENSFLSFNITDITLTTEDGCRKLVINDSDATNSTGMLGGLYNRNDPITTIFSTYPSNINKNGKSYTLTFTMCSI